MGANASSGALKLPKVSALKLEPTPDSKIQPIRHPTINAQKQLCHGGTKLFFGLVGWTLDQHLQ
jgi:hypothetical protein